MKKMQKSLRILCKASLDIAANSPGIKWLIGASFLPFTIISSINCLHVSEDDPFLPRYSLEAEVLQELLPRGLEIAGAFFVGSDNGVDNAKKAGKVALEMRKCLYSDDSFTNSAVVITKDPSNINHFLYNEGTDSSVEGFETVVYQEHPSQYLWNTACLVRCKCLLKLPVYLSSTKSLGDQYALVQEEFMRNLKGSKTVFQVDTLSNHLNKCSPVLLRFEDTGGQFSCVVINKMTENVNSSNLAFSNLCPTHQYLSVAPEVEIPKPINVSILLHSSCGNSKAHAPIIEYYPAKEDVEIMLLSITLDVLCVSSMESSLAESVSNLIIPGLIYQLAAAAKFLSARVKQPKLHAYHFCPRGFLHPVTAVYDMSMGETEINQVHLREKLHARLNLPVDRPMLRAANALNLEVSDSIVDDPTRKRGQKRLTNVHHGLSNSGIAGGQISLVDGTYDYYHYLQDDVDDNGWGCAYRSLQTIISWFRNQHYTSLNVPSHRKIQETLVEIGDKETGFIGSKEWIGAIELSFVLDKLLGVSCKILNVRSGTELPEKCRELALHFSTQGTPVMIGGGVLAYTLLGVDFNSSTGDCAFLILDPHYTGADDLRSIQSAGWCGWKKAISSKGKEFFLRDKFYNLLLPQRPNMV